MVVLQDRQVDQAQVHPFGELGLGDAAGGQQGVDVADDAVVSSAGVGVISDEALDVVGEPPADGERLGQVRLARRALRARPCVLPTHSLARGAGATVDRTTERPEGIPVNQTQLVLPTVAACLALVVRLHRQLRGRTRPSAALPFGGVGFAMLNRGHR